MAFEYAQSKLVICEGNTDVQFLRYLLQKHGIFGFDVDFPYEKGEFEGGGVDKIGKHIRAIRLQENFIRNVKTIVVMSDNDDADAYSRVADQISNAGITPPAQPQQFVDFNKDGVRIAILMIPTNGYGCLETLCTAAAYGKWAALHAPLQTLKGVSGAGGWSASKQSKMEIQCILAATCKKKPDVSMGRIWQQAEKYHIPLDDLVFDPIVTFLGGL
jgi:hypothetical protein